MPGQVDRPVDQTGLRRLNLSRVLRTLRSDGPQSRALLARRTGLNKATTSSLVAELEQRRLVQLGAVVAGAVGRPSQPVELRGRAVCGIGLEINVNYAAVAVLDLTDQILFSKRVSLDVVALGQVAAIDLLADLATEAIGAMRDEGSWVAGVTAAVPGLVDAENGIVRHAPNLRWREASVAERLAGRLDLARESISVDNDANLSALAEHAFGVAAGASDLLYLTGEVGVGGGVIADGRLVRGATGFTGEVGHMPLNPSPADCGCGRKGCWETQVGLAALLRAVADPGDEVHDSARDLEQRLRVIASRAADGEPRTRTALAEIGSALGVGASILVNVLNPTAVVLGGYFALLGEWLAEPARRELTGRVMASGSCRLVLSDLGFTAAVRGGAHAALDRVVADPSIAPTEVPHLGGIA
ncbi:ROK family transcriptional regulator [Allokutzneria albata]|uniref:Sugar kinase of the NBD/HSP70 family, may contain an N-terminal HTH domain n=1 Tax=Allokutzneria albata TaxID=211114 RepID=A0A1H0B9L9_ALLAB|nr:ROK family transcriptional regulator [Allokutzneria albata]SDN42340.1 Sugar kinase of the NBD/HSP70 family, may contain an N-terminal HTH domain [Allokutzneria albata]